MEGNPGYKHTERKTMNVSLQYIYDTIHRSVSSCKLSFTYSWYNVKDNLGFV